MYENLGNNLFDTLPEFYFGQISSRIFVTDFNNDSLQDVLFQLSDKSGYNIYYNQGDFQLADSQFVALPPSNPQEGWRNCYCADMDGNGFNDILTVKTLYVYLPDNLEILFNDGSGNFQEEPITKIQYPIAEYKNPISIYPNPFKEKTTIQIYTSRYDYIKLEIFDLKGSLIKTFIDKNNTWDAYEFIWNGNNQNGKEVQPGIYHVRLNSGRKVYSQQVIKIK
jgi:hypothetical protein